LEKWRLKEEELSKNETIIILEKRETTLEKE